MLQFISTAWILLPNSRSVHPTACLTFPLRICVSGLTYLSQIESLIYTDPAPANFTMAAPLVQAKNLSVILDSFLSLTTHIQSVNKSTEFNYFSLTLFPAPDCCHVDPDPIISHLDY